MKRIILLIAFIIVIALAGFFLIGDEPTTPQVVTSNPTAETETSSEATATKTPPLPKIATIVTGLEIPWDIAFIENESMLVTERTGHLILITKEGVQKEIPVPGVKKTGEGGLLGVELHPEYETNHLLYLYMSTGGTVGATQNQVIRYRFLDETLTEDKVIISGIPGAIYHDGGRMEFGPDGLLYITTGDATDPDIAQDIRSLGGKILRITDDGSVPSDNPFGTRVYSYGHRNPQGLAWDSEGRLWSTEHGRSGVRSGLDEVNLIEPGKNYGWPTIEGDAEKADMVSPTLHSGTSATWAPASSAIIGNSLFFGGLLGEALYEAVLDGENVTELKTHFKGEYGRIRTVRVGPDGMLYLTTSNRDGRGDPIDTDDRILRVNPSLLE